MTAKHLAAAVAVTALALAGCALTSPEERARDATVRVVKNADAVLGCQPIGSVTDDEIQDLQRRAARLGGNVALVTFEQTQTSRVSGPRTYTTAEVYRCGDGR